MKLMQLNAWGGRIYYHLLNFLVQQNADILMMQEVNSSPDDNELFNFLQRMEKKTGLPETFFSPRWDAMFGHMRVFYGNAIMSRLPLDHRHTEFTYGKYEVDFVRADYHDGPINFQHTIAETPDGKKFHLVNYHGYCLTGGIKTGNELTAQHCQQIADYMAKLQGPKILAGDFNLQPDSPSLAPLNKAYRNLCIEHDIKTTRNIFAYPKETVDYIWVSNEVIVKQFDVLPDLISDHAALLLEFDL